jgi:hypothetical protein
MNIKKLIRLFLKVPATPLYVLFQLLMISVGYGFKFFEWVYETNGWDEQFTQEQIQSSKQNLKKWFTTI